jgi:hypothetical protein
MEVRGDADLEVLRAMASLNAGLPVKIDQRRKARRRHADIGKRERQSELARPRHAVRGPSGPDPDRQLRLHRARRDWRIVQGRTKGALPGDALTGVEAQQQIYLFREQPIGIRDIITEQRERLGEDAAAGDHLGAPAREEVHGRKILKDLYGISRGQDRHGAGEP